MSQAYIDFDGAPLYYEEQGEGKPLLLVHAGVADSRMWDEQFDTFAEYYRVIRYDLRGFGKSDLPPIAFANHEDTKTLLDTLGVDQTAIVGISFGGRTAIDFALAYPKRVAALVLGAPSISGDQPSQAIADFGEKEDALLEKGDLDAAAELNVRMWVDGPNRMPEQVNQSVRDRVREMQRHAFTIPIPEGCQIRGLEPSAVNRLHELMMPTLVIVGDQDHSGVLERSDRICRDAPYAEQMIMPGAAHMLNMELPDEFNQTVMSFLQQHYA